MVSAPKNSPRILFMRQRQKAMTTLALMYSTQKLVKSAKNSTRPYLN